MGYFRMQFLNPTVKNHLLKFSWIGPLLFVTAILLFGSLNPGYSHISQFISELGAKGASHGELMNYLGIIPFGLSILLFSIGSIIALKKNILNKISFIVLSITGILFIMAGIFSCDEGCNFEDMSQEAIVHNLSAFMAFVLFLISAILFGINSFTKKRNKSYLFSLISGLVGIFLFYVISTTGIYSEFRGLYQRLFITNFLIWLIIIGGFVHKTTYNHGYK